MVAYSATSSQHGSNVVDSLLHPLAVKIRETLDGTRKESSPRLIVIDDEENIMQALRAGVKVEQVFYTKDQPASEGLKRALPAEASVREIARRTSKKLFETDKLSRLFAVAQAPAGLSLKNLANLKRDLVVLDHLGVSGNIGAIIRTAVAFGMGGVVLTGMDTGVYDRRLIRASRGHIFSLPVVKTTIEELLQFCKDHDWQLLVTDPRALHSVYDIAPLEGRRAIVFGSEKKGCSAQLLEAASFQFKIPTASKVESLNVAAAAAITLFHRAER